MEKTTGLVIGRFDSAGFGKGRTWFWYRWVGFALLIMVWVNSYLSIFTNPSTGSHKVALNPNPFGWLDTYS
jgi:hypothetical protein